MTVDQAISELISILLSTHPEHSFLARSYSNSLKGKRELLRGLMNLCPAHTLPKRFYELESALLEFENRNRTYISSMRLPVSNLNKIAHYHGNIVDLEVDAIVNSASSEFLGCFVPGHKCLENEIHSFAGMELRDACDDILKKEKKQFRPGYAAITSGFHLFSRHVIHVIIPHTSNRVTNLALSELKLCYKSALRLAENYHLKSIAFPALATGSAGFSKELGASLAIDTCHEYLVHHPSSPVIIFVTNNDSDKKYYESYLGI